MNYFTAYTPSREAGITVLNEVQQFNKVPLPADASEFDQPRAPTGAGAWSLAEMIHEVGLPVPVDDPDGNPIGTAAAGRLRDWIALYPGPVTQALAGNAYPRWLDLNDRVVLNERATRFHTRMGERPAAEMVDPHRVMGFNLLRHSVEDFDDFLKNLESAPGNPVGGVWAIGGKDHANVLFLCRTLRTGGANGFRSLPGTPDVVGRTILIALPDEDEHRIMPNSTGQGFDIQPDVIPRKAV